METIKNYTLAVPQGNEKFIIELTQADVSWRRCQLDKGTFSDEVAVTYPPQGPWQKSVFVDANLVEGTVGGYWSCSRENDSARR